MVWSKIVDTLNFVKGLALKYNCLNTSIDVLLRTPTAFMIIFSDFKCNFFKGDILLENKFRNLIRIERNAKVNPDLWQIRSKFRIVTGIFSRYL